MIDPDAGVYPMVGPGASYAQMITGDFIPARSSRRTGEAARDRHVLTPRTTGIHAMQHTLSILLQNEAGALVRVAGLFAARSHNIDTLTVAATTILPFRASR
jgi:hypothetical protein